MKGIISLSEERESGLQAQNQSKTQVTKLLSPLRISLLPRWFLLVLLKTANSVVEYIK